MTEGFKRFKFAVAQSASDSERRLPCCNVITTAFGSLTHGGSSISDGLSTEGRPRHQ